MLKSILTVSHCELACVQTAPPLKKNRRGTVCDLPLIIVFHTTWFFLECVENDLIGYYPSIITSLKQRVLIGFYFYFSTSTPLEPPWEILRWVRSVVCTLSTVQNTNKNLFDGQRGFSYKVRAELLSIECKVEIDSTYICRNCQRKRKESALHEVNIALFKRLSTRKRLPLFLTSQCNPNQPGHSQVQSTKRAAMEDLRMYTPRKITAHRQRSVLFWRSEPYLVGRLANTSSPLKSASML